MCRSNFLNSKESPYKENPVAGPVQLRGCDLAGAFCLVLVGLHIAIVFEIFFFGAKESQKPQKRLGASGE